MKPDALLRRKFASVWRMLDERTRRLMAASEALVLPYGGVSRVHRACGLSRNAIAKGIREIQSGGAGSRAGAAPRRGTQTDHGARSPAGGGVGPADRARHAGRPRVPLALGLQEHAGAGRRAAPAAASDQSREGGATPPPAALQSARHAQDRRGRGPSGSRCAVPAYQCQRQEGLGRRPPRAVGGHQEEGVGRELRQRRPPMAPDETGAPGAGA